MNGDKALIGATRDGRQRTDSGVAYIFAYDGNTWVQKQKLNANDISTDDYFGRSVSIYGDRALIGSYLRNTPGKGSAYVFEYKNQLWSQSQKLTANDGNQEDLFGFSVSMSGNKAFVGASNDEDNGSVSGSAYVFIEDMIYKSGFESTIISFQ